MLVLVMCVLAFASCGGCDTCVDADKDGKCDNCGKDVAPVNPDPDPDPVLTPVTEDEWKAAFAFTNVTIDMAQVYTEGGEEETQTFTYRITGGEIYGGQYGYGFYKAPSSDYIAQVTAPFNFSDSYAKFTFADGVYTADEIEIDSEEVGLPTGSSITATNIVVTLDASGKITTIKMDAVTQYSGQEPIVGEVEYKFYAYGNTKPAAMTYDQYDAAAIDADVVVEAYVQATQSWWSNKITVYLADREGAYFAYEMACSEADAAKLTPGTMIRIEGTKAAWAGEVEIVDCTFTLVEGADTYVAEAKDLTNYLDIPELINYQNQLAKFTDMTVKSVEYKNGTPGDDIYVTFTKGGVDYSFCVEYYLNGSDADFYGQFATLAAGDVVDVEGFVYWYNGINTHITKITKK